MSKGNNEYDYQPPAKFTEELRQRINNAGFSDEFKQQIKSAQKEEGRKMLERLTLWDDENKCWVEDHSRDTREWKNGHNACMNRLAAYEDSGLTPEQVQELTKAKAEGRLVVLPCKTEDTVFIVYAKKRILETIVYKRAWTDDDGYMLRTKEEEWFKEKDIGKTVFLTREEAEKAIGGKEDV